MPPIIGITMFIDKSGKIRKNTDSNYISREYGKALRRVGAQPIFLDPSIDPMVAAKLCDGIVICGGRDIDPQLYGQSVRHDGPKEPRERTDWERQLIDACDAFERPVLGICYGMQLLNVHYGGTLYQDIKIERQSDLFHGSLDNPAVHQIDFYADFLGYRQGDVVQGTHVHHQAVNAIAPGFTAVAHAQDGGVEAIAGRGHFGIQWHAELDQTAQGIYGEFVQKCQAQPMRVTRKSFRVKKMPRFLFRFSK